MHINSVSENCVFSVLVAERNCSPNFVQERAMPFKRQYNKLLGQLISHCGVFLVTGKLESNTGQLSKSKHYLNQGLWAEFRSYWINF